MTRVDLDAEARIFYQKYIYFISISNKIISLIGKKAATSGKRQYKYHAIERGAKNNESNRGRRYPRQYSATCL